jgi:hypothetical protein
MDNLLIILIKNNCWEYQQLPRGPVMGMNRGRMAKAGEKTIESGKKNSGSVAAEPGGTWARPYDEERLGYGSLEADQIKATGAEIVVAPRHHCRDQIMQGLSKVHDLGNYEWLS